MTTFAFLYVSYFLYAECVHLLHLPLFETLSTGVLSIGRQEVCFFAYELRGSSKDTGPSSTIFTAIRTSFIHFILF